MVLLLPGLLSNIAYPALLASRLAIQKLRFKGSVHFSSDPIWFGIVVVKMCEVCLITPPIGLNCYVVAGVRPDIPLQEVFRGIGPFFIADVITLGVFLAWPEVITWLPDLMITRR